MGEVPDGTGDSMTEEVGESNEHEHHHYDSPDGHFSHPFSLLQKVCVALPVLMKPDTNKLLQVILQVLQNSVCPDEVNIVQFLALSALFNGFIDGIEIGDQAVAEGIDLKMGLNSRIRFLLHLAEITVHPVSTDPELFQFLGVLGSEICLDMRVGFKNGSPQVVDTEIR